MKQGLIPMKADLWKAQLKFDPVPKLISSNNEALLYFTQKDLLEQEVGPIGVLWELPEAVRRINRQQESGSWKYGSTKHESIRSNEDYDQIETYRILGQLVEIYGLSKKHPSIQRAADFLFNSQSKEGDFRGIYDNQYSPNYSAAIMELLIKSGYSDDPRIEKGFNWLLSIKQDDGGWVIPFRTDSSKYNTISKAFGTPILIEPDKSKPFSHLVTGVVLRAFAAHPMYRKTKEAKQAGNLLKSRFFKADKYIDRKDPAFWTKFRYPFWFTDLISALDSLSLLGFSKDDPEIQIGLNWFIANQSKDGLWKTSFEKAKDKRLQELHLWVALAVCRVFKRFDEQT